MNGTHLQQTIIFFPTWSFKFYDVSYLDYLIYLNSCRRYQRSPTVGWKTTGIRKSEFVAKA